jgi:hypothetical protein
MALRVCDVSARYVKLSKQNKKSRTNESELKKIGEGSEWDESEGKGTRTIQYPVTQSNQGAREHVERT